MTDNAEGAFSEVRERLARHRFNNLPMSDRITTARETSDLLDEVEQLWLALAQFGKHVDAGPDRCPYLDQQTGDLVHAEGAKPCTCGLLKALGVAP